MPLCYLQMRTPAFLGEVNPSSIYQSLWLPPSCLSPRYERELWKNLAEMKEKNIWKLLLTFMGVLFMGQCHDIVQGFCWLIFIIKLSKESVFNKWNVLCKYEFRGDFLFSPKVVNCLGYHTVKRE
jgi:hypothetical protein